MRHQTFQNNSICAIVIARDEASALPRLLARLREIPQVGAIVLADGGSRDQTIALAQNRGALVVTGARGRGPQFNLGAQHAKQTRQNQILWFLHADAFPARTCGADIERAVENGAIGGHFRLKFAAQTPKTRVWARFFAQIARFQAQFGTFYGDSGMWATRAAFQNAGQFPNWPLFEDLSLARRLQKMGKVVTCPSAIYASARRFERQPARVLALWLELQIRFNCGQNPDELAQIYRARSG